MSMARPDEYGNITCTGCNRDLPGDVAHFHRHRDAFKPKCKECRGSSFGVSDMNKVVQTPEGKKLCSQCKSLLPAEPEYFHHTKRTSDGFTSACKKCRCDTDYGVQHPNEVLDIPEGKWMCSACDSILPLSPEFFYTDGNGFRIYCKACYTQKKNQSRRAAENGVANDLSSKDWTIIRAKWLNGGIVTCAYCGDETPSPERDHIIPLSDGGDTVADNIVPACDRCNRLKGSDAVGEWYPESGYFNPQRWDKIQVHIENPGTL